MGKQMMERLLLTRNKMKAFKVISMLYLELRDQKSFPKHDRGRITQRPPAHRYMCKEQESNFTVMKERCLAASR